MIRAEHSADGVLFVGEATPEQMQPVPYMYDLGTAAQLLPMTTNQLAMFLRRRKSEFPPRYWKRNDRRWVRVLLAHEIRAIRARYVKGDVAPLLMPPADIVARKGSD